MTSKLDFEAALAEQRQHTLGLVTRQMRGLDHALEAIEAVALTGGFFGKLRRIGLARRYLREIREIMRGER